MRQLRITINLDGDAFGTTQETESAEVASILRRMIAGAGDYLVGPRLGLVDSNGNLCGQATVTRAAVTWPDDDDAANQRAVLEAIRCQGDRGATFEWIRSRIMSGAGLTAGTLATLVADGKVEKRLVQSGETRYYLTGGKATLTEAERREVDEAADRLRRKWRKRNEISGYDE